MAIFTKANWKWVTLLWMLITLILSVISGKNLPSVAIVGIDKIAHLICYALLSFLWMGTLLHIPFSRSKAIFYAIVISSMYGIVMEMIQYGFFPHRSFEIPDIIANIIGSFIGATLYVVIFRIFKR